MHTCSILQQGLTTIIDGHSRAVRERFTQHLCEQRTFLQEVENHYQQQTSAAVST